MSKRALVLALTVVAAASLACSFSFELPSVADGAQRGPLVTEDILVPRPAAQDVALAIHFAAGDLSIHPGAAEALVEGRARYNVDQLRPTVRTEDGRVVLSSGELENFTDLDFDLDLDGVQNEWDLALSQDPMALEIAGGAFAGEFDLSGLALRELRISSGASDMEVIFDEPNPIRMDRLQVSTGASEVLLHGLANAGFRRLELQGGVGDYTLDFTGELRDDAEVRASAAMSSLTLVVPEDLNVRLTVEGALAEIDVPEGFTHEGDQYVQSGSGPRLTIRVEVGAGEVEVRRP